MTHPTAATTPFQVPARTKPTGPHLNGAKAAQAPRATPSAGVIENPSDYIDGAAPAAFITDITPDLAEQWLTRNTHNRKIKTRKVDAYVEDMTNGAWHLDGSGIKFSVTGVLLDGQQRLTAITKAGITCRSVIVVGLEDDAQDVMDTGATRSAADQLALRGFTSSAALAAAVKLLIMWDTGRIPAERAYSTQLTHSTVLAYTEAHPELGEQVRSCVSLGGIKSPLAAKAAAYVILHRTDPTNAELFFARCHDGANLNPDSPILALRERLSSMYTSGTKIRANVKYEPEVYLHLFFRAWNAWKRGERTKKFYIVHPESTVKFPKPI